MDPGQGDRTDARRSPPRAIAAITGLVVAALGVVATPWPPQLAEAEGDADLADRAAAILETMPGPHEHLAVAEIDGDDVTFAGFGADASTEFEIGSLAKPFTTQLFAIAVDLGEVEPGTTVGDVLDVGNAPVADVTLEELASQRSGLPSVPSGAGWFLRSAIANLRATDPYPPDLDAVVEAARAAELEGRGEMRYSNLGMALLGHALAASAGTDYGTLIEERVLAPLGLAATRLPIVPDAVGDAPTGHTASGRPAGVWTMYGFASAGGIRSTTGDVVAWVRATMDGDFPGESPMDPRFDSDVEGERIGWAWFTTPVETADGDLVDVTWHNGMTGGFASIVAVDRERDRAVVVLSDTAVPVDALGIALLLEGR